MLASSSVGSLIGVTAIGILGVLAGVLVTSWTLLSRPLVPFGGGILMGVALFWVLPEMAVSLQWPWATAWVGLGFGILWAIDRYVHPVCPVCSPSHDHEGCETRLHGFAAPLLLALALHSALDGWSLAAAGGDVHLSGAFLTGIAAHKLPEGLALGVIARAALGSRAGAIGLGIAAQLATLAGGALESAVAVHLAPASVHVLLALAGGTFLYLGGHAVHGELRRNGATPALVPALTGVAGSSVLRLLVQPWR